MKIVRIWSFSGRFFPAFELNMQRYGRSISPYVGRIRENTDQKKYEYRYFSRSDIPDGGTKQLLNPFHATGIFLYSTQN